MLFLTKKPQASLFYTTVFYQRPTVHVGGSDGFLRSSAVLNGASFFIFGPFYKKHNKFLC